MGLMDPNVPAYLMSTVKESDARAAYNALIDFAQVVKANPISPSTPASSVSGSAASSISAAADKLSAAAYPFIKDIDWTSDLYSKPIPGANPQQVTKAIGKMISMGAAMDGASLKEAANAHVKAIGGMDGRGVLSESDFAAINAGLGKAIASVPTTKVMDVYNAMAKVVGNSGVPNKLFSTVNPNDAQAAYSALLEFKDVVKAAHAEGCNHAKQWAQQCLFLQDSSAKLYVLFLKKRQALDAIPSLPTICVQPVACLICT